jgi:hypothetical protein
LYTARAQIKGGFTRDSYPTAINLDYKIGAQVMMLNNDSRRRWVNGSIGVIEGREITDDDEGGGEAILTIRLQDTDKTVAVTPFTWEMYQFKVDGATITTEPAGSFTQYPFRLAWAVTIHKSQGKTFERVIIDFDRGTFVSGQAYVALSRCTTLGGMVLSTPLHKKHIQTDHRVSKFMTAYQYHRAAQNQSPDQRVAIITQAIAAQERLAMTYLKANDTKSQRVIRPLSIGSEVYRGKTFYGMRAWCETSNEERMFHVGRILELEPLSAAILKG